MKDNHKLPDQLSQGFRIIRPLLILFITIAHIPIINNYALILSENSLTFDGLITIFLKGTFIKGAVPLLSLISGYLALKSYYQNGYFKMVIKKINRLIIPMIFINFLFIFLITLPYQDVNPSYRADLTLSPFNLKGWLQATLGVYVLPANPPLYFLKDLFTCFLLLPILLQIIKIKYLNVLFLLWLAYKAYIDSNVFIVSVFPLVFFRIDILLAFCIGLFCYYYGKRFWITNTTHCKKIILSYLLFCGFMAYLILIFDKRTNHQLFLFIDFSIKFFGIFAAIHLMRWLTTTVNLRKTLAWLSPYSFTLFLTHNFAFVLFAKYYVQVFSLPSFNSLNGWFYLFTLLIFSILFAIAAYQGWHFIRKKISKPNSKNQC